MKIVDGDGHVMEDTVELAKFLPDGFKHLTDRQRIFPPLDHFHAFIGETPPGSFRNVGREGWLEFLEDVGIDTTVMYTTQGLAVGKVFHRDWAIALCKAYNDYVHEEYLVRSPRFQAMALIPLQEPSAAVEELERAVTELGFCGAMLPSTSIQDLNLGAKEYWPVYAKADELRCALGVHGGAHEGMGFDGLNVYTPVPAIGHPHGLVAGGFRALRALAQDARPVEPARRADPRRGRERRGVHQAPHPRGTGVHRLRGRRAVDGPCRPPDGGRGIRLLVGLPARGQQRHLQARDRGVPGEPGADPGREGKIGRAH